MNFSSSCINFEFDSFKRILQWYSKQGKINFWSILKALYFFKSLSKLIFSALLKYSSNKIFSEPSKQRVWPSKPHFLHWIGVFSMILAWKHERNLKNDRQLTFGALESDWDVVRSYRLLLRLTMIQNNSPQALVVIRGALENFFRTLEATCMTLQTQLFAFNWSF